MWYLRTLGQLSLHPEGPESDSVLRNAKALAILAYLACVPGHTVRRDHLATLLWPGAGSRRGRRSLRQALYYLSKKADDRLVRADDEKLTLSTDRIAVDVVRFERALEEERWAPAVELYEGRFLAGYGGKAGREFEGWIETRNERVWAGVKAACHELVERALEEGSPEEAVRFAERWVELNPLDERAQRIRIEALLASGDRVGAYQAYESYRALLSEELDDLPDEKLRARLAELRGELFGSGGAEEGQPASPKGPGATPARRVAPGRAPVSSDFRLWVAVAVTAVAAAALTLTLASPWSGASDRGPATAWDEVSADLLARRDSGGGDRWHVALRDGRVSVAPSGLDARELPDPTGRRLATVRRETSGPDVVVRQAGAGTRPVAATRWDEVPLTWAPDGRYLVVKRGFLDEGEADLRPVAYVCSVETGVERRLADLELAGRRPVAWSPTGTRLALSAADDGGGSEIYRVDADGTGLIPLSRDPARDEEPAWSPDGERLAFVSWRTGQPQVWIVGGDGRTPEQVTFGSARARSPVWVSDHHLVHLSDRGGGWDLWSLDLVSRRTRRLTELGDLRPGEFFRWSREPPGALVDRVVVRPRPRTVSPGQWLRLEGRALTREGTEVPAARRALRWTADDTSVLARREGWFRVLAEGRARVEVSAGGWRADTIRLASVPLRVRRDLPLLFEDDWSEGISREAWHVAGTPEPYLVRVGAPALETPAPTVGPAAGETDAPSPASGMRAFVSNGDENYASGLVTRDPLPLEEGLTIAFRASLPFDAGAPFQSMMVGLDEGVSGPEEREVRMDRPDVFGLVVGAENRSMRVLGDGTVESLPWLPEPEAWHRYALQVARDGRAALVRNDTLIWRSEPGLVATDRDVHLTLGGRSLGIETLVGPVRVHEGERYVLDGGPRP